MNKLNNQTVDVIEIAGGIVSAYVSNNSVPSSELPELLRSVHAALAGLATRMAVSVSATNSGKPTPAQIRKSVTPGGIVSFLDGRTYKTLKRHLTGHGLDPHGYRQRYGLPADYPMVAPDYAAHRSALAKSIGLGRGSDHSKGSQPPAKAGGKAA